MEVIIDYKDKKKEANNSIFTNDEMNDELLLVLADEKTKANTCGSCNSTRTYCCFDPN